MFLTSYVLFVIYASLKTAFVIGQGKINETVVANHKLLMAFSIGQNWLRLKTVKDTPEVEEFRVFQAVRTYNSMIVMFAHSTLFMAIGPTVNPRIAENVNYE